MSQSAELRALIENSATTTELVTRLLIFGREGAADYRAARNDPMSLETEADLHAEVLGIFDEARSSVLTGPTKSRLLSLLDDAAPPVVIARGIARGVADATSDQIRAALQRQRVVYVGTDTLVPTPRMNFRNLRGLISDPNSLPAAESPDRVPGFRLGSAITDSYAVSLDARFHDALSQVGGPQPQRNLVVATLHPNIGVGEFTELEDIGAKRFFRYGPLDLQKQAKTLLAQADVAISRGADIVVVPELCTTKAIAEDMAARFAGTTVKVAVLGSEHVVDENGYRRNSAYLWITGARYLTCHHKIEPVKVDGLTEDIHIEEKPTVTVYTSVHTNLVVATCRDLLSEQFQRLVIDVGANVVLVPAMTPKVEGFESAARAISTATQAVVVVANNPESVCSTRALVARPYRVDPLRSCNEAGRGVFVVDALTGDQTWLRTGD